MQWNYLVPLIVLFLVINYHYSMPGPATPTLSRLKVAFWGMIVAASLCLLINTSLAHLNDIELLQKSNMSELFPLFLTMTSSVLIEELFFRGILFLILVAYLPMWPAILLSSLSFAVFHWFSYGVIGSAAAMLAVALTTGSFGAVMCFAYFRSHTLLVPIAIHSGWNLTSAIVIDISGQQKALFSTPQSVPKDWPAFFAFIIAVVMLLLFVKVASSRSHVPSGGD